MITQQVLIPIVILLNIIPTILLILVYKKLSVQRISGLFSLLILAGMVWGNSTILYRYEGFDPATQGILIKLNFISATILAHFFFLFFIAFSEGQRLISKPVHIVLLLSTSAVILLCLMGQIVESFEIRSDVIRLHYGTFFPYFVGNALALELAGIFVLIRIFKRTTNELMKFQISVLLRYGATVFALVLLTNVVMPVILKTSRYSFIGPFLALFFFLAVFRLLFSGVHLFAMQVVRKMLQIPAFKIIENTLAFREAIFLLKSSLLSGAGLRQVKFTLPDGTVIPISIGVSGTGVSLQAEGSAVKIADGVKDTIQILENDNRHLALSLVRAETKLQEQWLTNVVKTLPTREMVVFDNSYALADYLPALEKNVQDNAETFSTGFCALSPVMNAVLARIQTLNITNDVVIFEGEPGTGKTTLARAANYYLTKSKKIIEISCQVGDIQFLTEQLEDVRTRVLNRKKCENILLRDVQNIPVHMFSMVEPLINAAAGRVVIYLTMTPEYLSELAANTPQLLHKLNQVKLQVPALRRRGDDILFLIIWYLSEFSKKSGARFTHVSKDFVQAVREQVWPGNIVELKNTLAREIISNRTPMLEKLHTSDRLALSAPGESLSPLELAEKRVITEFLRKNNYNKNRTRIELNITVNTLNAKIQKYQVWMPDAE